MPATHRLKTLVITVDDVIRQHIAKEESLLHSPLDKL